MRGKKMGKRKEKKANCRVQTSRRFPGSPRFLFPGRAGGSKRRHIWTSCALSIPPTSAEDAGSLPCVGPTLPNATSVALATRAHRRRDPVRREIPLRAWYHDRGTREDQGAAHHDRRYGKAPVGDEGQNTLPEERALGVTRSARSFYREKHMVIPRANRPSATAMSGIQDPRAGRPESTQRGMERAGAADVRHTNFPRQRTRLCRAVRPAGRGFGALHRANEPPIAHNGQTPVESSNSIGRARRLSP